MVNSKTFFLATDKTKFIEIFHGELQSGHFEKAPDPFLLQHATRDLPAHKQQFAPGRVS